MGRTINSRAKSASTPGTAPEDKDAPRVEAVRPAQPAQPAAGLDAVGRLTLLKRAFEARPEQGPETKPNPWSDAIARLKQLAAKQRSRLLKVLVGALVVVAVGWLPVRTLLQTTSTEAVINARIVTLRAPIEGEIGPHLNTLAVGTQLDPNAALLRIVNKRADRGRLDDLRRL